MELREPSAKYLVRPRYKRTEVGVIPDDWDVHPLGHLTDANRPISYGIVQTGPNVRNGVRCLRVLDVENGRINKSDLITTTREISAAYKRTILKAGDLVMPLRGKVGDVGIIDEDLSGSNLTRGVALIAIRSDWSGPFCRQFIAAPSTRGRLEQAMNGSALQEIPIAALRAFKIALPPTKAEQDAIAEALSDADALIESLDQLIAKKRDLKQGAMQELLTGKKRLPGFTVEPGYRQTKGIEIPKDWRLETLDVVSKVPMQNGLFFKPSLKGSGVRLINVGDLFGRAPIDTQTLELFSASSEERERFKVLSGDLFFTRSSIVPSGIAHCNVYISNALESVVFDSHVIRLRPDTTKVDPTFLFRFCVASVARKYLVSNAKTGTMTTVDQGVLGKCPIFLPPLAEQTAIAVILSDMDTELAELQSRLAKARQIKQGMMQDLLTGRIRLL